MSLPRSALIWRIFFLRSDLLGYVDRVLLTTKDSALVAHFESNTLLPIALFKDITPLITSDAKIILISSSLGSIGDMEDDTPSLAYGVSKAGANYFVRKVHFENQQMTAVALHPG